MFSNVNVRSNLSLNLLKAVPKILSIPERLSVMREKSRRIEVDFVIESEYCWCNLSADWRSFEDHLKCTRGHGSQYLAAQDHLHWCLWFREAAKQFKTHFRHGKMKSLVVNEHKDCRRDYKWHFSLQSIPLCSDWRLKRFGMSEDPSFQFY